MIVVLKHKYSSYCIPWTLKSKRPSKVPLFNTCYRISKVSAPLCNIMAKKLSKLGRCRKSGVTPKQSGVTPKQSGVTPKQSGVTPKQSGVTPKQSGVTPKQSGVTPKQSGVCPTGHAYFLDFMELTTFFQSNIRPNYILFDCDQVGLCPSSFSSDFVCKFG